MIQVRAFKPEIDMETYKNWRKGWGKHDAGELGMSQTGFMAYKTEDGHKRTSVMCAFLILTNSTFAFAGTPCSDPNSSWEDRTKATQAICDSMVGLARSLGFERVVTYTYKAKLAEKIIQSGWSVADNLHFALFKEVKNV